MILDKVRYFLWKSKPEFWTYSFIRCPGPKLPKLSFLDPRPQVQDIFWDFITFLCQSFEIWNFFHVKLHKILHKFLYCKNPIILIKFQFWPDQPNFLVKCHITYNLELTTFSGSLFFAGEVLLNWLYRTARSEGDFSESKLSL